MAIDPAGPGKTPLPTHGSDGVADPEHAALAADLETAVDGDVRFDEYAQVLYATDGSIYGARPAGVVIPESEADVVEAVEVAADHGAPVLPRGAGSSLAGQTVGPGCVVLDCSKHLNDILEIDAEAKRTRVQPGVVQDDLDAALSPHGLKFAPDPASSNRATLGGGIGNNSTGAHSVRYGITVDYVESVRAVLADGTVAEFGEVVVGSEEWDEILSAGGRVAELHETVLDLVESHEDEIVERYPDIQRNVSGYSLDAVAGETADGERTLNLAKLFVGAEGTLGVVLEAELSLVTVPEETALALYCYEDLLDAMRAVPAALDHDASAVELMDDEVFRLARESAEFAQYAEPIPESAGAALMLEFDSELHDDLAAAVTDADARFLRGEDGAESGGEHGQAFDALHAFDADAQRDLWKLRKAAIPLLMSLEGDAKPYPFIEDASVPPETLAEYVEEFEQVLEEHSTSAAYFAHAGAGTLHIRPILSLKEEAGIETMRSIAEDVTDLVAERHGSFSGEHGDGLARTQFNPKLYGPDLWQAFKDLKTAFDPDWRMNPGKVVFRDDAPTEMTEYLRYGADYASLEPATMLGFDEEGGFSHLVELCNGCGTCRTTQSDVMCPTYRATGEELATTRGRANLLRAAISGDLPEEEMHSDRFHEAVLDLCVGCKGCQSDCPTGVDLAKLKAELKHQRHEREGASTRARLFADIDRLAEWGSKLAPISNWLARLPGSGAFAERLLGITPERDVPEFASESFEAWFQKREARLGADEAAEKVVFLPDTYTNYVYPEVGKAAVEVLEAADCHVAVPEGLAPPGRAAVSGGFLDLATERARTNVDALAPLVAEGWSVVTAEPSDAAVVQDEYADLLDGEDVAAVAASTYGVCEFLDVHRADALGGDAGGESVAYHGHCNQKALNRDHHAAAVLARAGYDVETLDSTCCGMAGSFGYESEHYELSMAIGEQLFDQVRETAAEPVAPGASCRTQLSDWEEQHGRVKHPVEKLAESL